MKITYTQQEEIRTELNDFKNRLRREGESLLKSNKLDVTGLICLKHSKKIFDLLETL